MTGVISALPVNHRVGLSLGNVILKIRSRVNDCRSLWGKLLSSMIKLRLNVTNNCGCKSCSELQTFQTLISGSARATHVQTCFPEQPLGILMACQSKTHGDVCQCEERGPLAEVRTRSS